MPGDRIVPGQKLVMRNADDDPAGAINDIKRFLDTPSGFGSTLPTRGNYPGEHFFNTTTQVDWCWDGDTWIVSDQAPSGDTLPSSGQYVGQHFFSTAASRDWMWDGTTWQIAYEPVQTYSPTIYQQATFGPTTVVNHAYYRRSNGNCHAWVQVTAGSTSYQGAGNGILVTLPITAKTSNGAMNVGSGLYYNNDTGTRYNVQCELYDSNNVWFGADRQGFIGSNPNFNCVIYSVIRFNICYPMA
jgi:hypothetical protein